MSAPAGPEIERAEPLPMKRPVPIVPPEDVSEWSHDWACEVDIPIAII